MISDHDNSVTTGIAGKKWPAATLLWLVAATALLARLPALGAYWNQDDWGLLGHAAGLGAVAGSAARWLSRVLYWDIMWPLAGLDPVPYAWTRIALHAAVALGVAMLARRLHLSVLQQLVAGLIMAASPLAFTHLYWAAGIQDLLAVTAAIWALVCWHDSGRRATLPAVALAVIAVLCKETVVGLPIIMVAAARMGTAAHRRGRGLLTLIPVVLAAAVALLLASRTFSTAADQPYALGGAATVLRNLLVYGWWLLQPGPVFSTDPPLPVALVGGTLWIVWFAWAWQRHRQNAPTPLLAWLGALVSLAPLLPLTRHLAPDLAYPVEPFGCLALACLVPGRVTAPPWLILTLVAAAGTWGFLGMEGRLGLREASGLPADPVVRRTAVSWQIARQLPRLPVGEAGLVFLQPPLTPETAAMAADLGENWVTGSDVYHSLGGALGPRLLLDDRVPVSWVNGLRHVPEGTLVLLDAGGEIKPWGFTDQALLYQALTDVAVGNFGRARLHLLRAGLLGGDTLSVLFDPGALPVSLNRVLARKEAFVDYLAAGLSEGRSALEVGGVQTNFFRLLSVCTGIDEETLRAGGHSLER